MISSLGPLPGAMLGGLPSAPATVREPADARTERLTLRLEPGLFLECHQRNYHGTLAGPAAGDGRYDPPNSPIGSPVPRRWAVSLIVSTLRSPLRAAATRWIDV